jgi:hypothetical protein
MELLLRPKLVFKPSLELSYILFVAESKKGLWQYMPGRHRGEVVLWLYP